MTVGGSMLMIDTVAPDDERCSTLLHHVETLRDPSHVRAYSVVQWTEMFDRVGLEVSAVHLMEYRVRLEEWLTRARTPESAATEVRAALLGAEKTCRDLFQVGPGGDFTLPNAMFVAKRRGGGS